MNVECYLLLIHGNYRYQNPYYWNRRHVWIDHICFKSNYCPFNANTPFKYIYNSEPGDGWSIIHILCKKWFSSISLTCCLKIVDLIMGIVNNEHIPNEMLIYFFFHVSSVSAIFVSCCQMLYNSKLSHPTFSNLSFWMNTLTQASFISTYFVSYRIIMVFVQ